MTEICQKLEGTTVTEILCCVLPWHGLRATRMGPATAVTAGHGRRVCAHLPRRARAARNARRGRGARAYLGGRPYVLKDERRRLHCLAPSAHSHARRIPRAHRFRGPGPCDGAAHTGNVSRRRASGMDCAFQTRVVRRGAATGHGMVCARRPATTFSSKT